MRSKDRQKIFERIQDLENKNARQQSVIDTFSQFLKSNPTVSVKFQNFLLGPNERNNDD